MDVLKADIAIVGAGGAGLRAAIAAAEHDPQLSIVLVSRSTRCAATPSRPKAARRR